MRLLRTMSCLLVMVALGCGSHPSSTPLAPSPAPAPPPSPPRHQILNGYVYDTAFRHVSGATVSLLDGAQAGASTTSNDSGRFSFTGNFQDPTTVRVSKAEYAPATGTATSVGPVSGEIWAFVVLDQLAKPADITGDYTLTIVADSACAGLPDDVRTRTYGASIRRTPDAPGQPGTSLTLTADGGSFLPSHGSFAIGVAGTDVAFSIYSGEDFGLVEKIAPATFLAVQGMATVSTGPGPVAKISTPFDGVIDYCVLQSDTGWNYDCNSGPRTAYRRCESKQHQLILSRR